MKCYSPVGETQMLKKLNEERKTWINSLAAHHAIPVNKINRRKSKAFQL
jgi:hypothetical protein